MQIGSISMFSTARNIGRDRGIASGSARTRLRRSLLLIAAVFTALSCSNDPDAGVDRELAFHGPQDELINAETVEEIGFTVAAHGEDAHLDDIVLTLDGKEVTDDASGSSTELVWYATGLEDGAYTLTALRTFEVEVDDDGNPVEEPQDPEILHEWSFRLDTTPPEIEITAPETAVVAGETVTITGTTEPGSEVTVEGRTATADDAGSFEVEIPEAPQGTLTIVATDAAGNSSDGDLTLVTVPSRVVLDEYRAAHLTGCAWGHEGLRGDVLQMIEEGRLNAVQLDLKDEDGIVNYASEVELAQQLRPEMNAGCTFDLDEAVTTLHERGIPIIARIVAFRDPTLVGWAWENGHRNYAVQTLDGERLPIYNGGMANFADDDVMTYNIELAREAAAAGVDHILWDYIRRPEGDLNNIVFEGLEGSVEDAIVEFTRRADEALKPYGIKHGASVYGIAATRPGQIGQDIPALSDHLDYVAPMLYPDHWGAGEFGLSNPNASPYEVIYESMLTFEEATEGRRAEVIPWLGDFGSRGMDPSAYIRAQVQASFDVGVRDFLLWNAGSRYTTNAYDPID